METRRVAVGCEFIYDAEVPTATVFKVQPDATSVETLRSESWDTTPGLNLHAFRDLYDNQSARVVLPEGRTTVRYEAIVDVADAMDDVDEAAREIAPEDLPDDTLLYTLPSRYCLSDVLGDEAWQRFGSVEPGYGRVQAIVDHVHQHLTFQYGSTSALSTAVDVNTSGLGVCRDYAHLAISFCRALNIPTRYVFGYIPFLDIPPEPDPPDFAAWMEVWLDDRWWTFDPRNNDHRKGHIVIGRGRDAADVAMATTYGNPWLVEMTVKADEVADRR